MPWSDPPSPWKPLRPALVISLTLHGLLLASSLLQSPPAPPKPRPLAVTLIPPEPPEKAPPPEPLLKNTLETPPEPAPAQAPKPPPQESRQDAASKKPAPARDEKELPKAALKAAQKKLSAIQYYPPEARTAGWQGDVLVRLSLSAQGDIDDADIAVSSGYPVLDKAALRALYALGRVEGAGGRREVLFPVSFRLR